MRIASFELERFFAQWEFVARHVLCASDVEPLGLGELLALAPDDLRRSWEQMTLGYIDSRGGASLRAEIAATYRGVGADDVLVTVGAEEGIFLTMHALLDAADHVIAVTPAYQSLYEVARSLGAELTLVSLRAPRWALDVDEIERAIRPRTRAIVVNFPHSPTGAQISAEQMSRLVELATRNGIVLFSDEVYRGLEHDMNDRLPAAVELSATAVSLGVMSKAYALAGLRVGWIASRHRELLARVARLKDYTTICGSAPSEALALMALRARDLVLARSRAIIAGNLERLDDLFARHADRIAWTRPRATSVAFPRLVADDVDIDSWCARLVEREGVLLLPGTRFSMPGPYFRIGYGRRDLPIALERLERHLREG